MALRQRKGKACVCGATLASDATFCSKCGKKQEEVDAKTAADETKDMSPEEILERFQEKMREAMQMKVREEAPRGTSEADIQKQVDEGLSRLLDPKPKPLPGIKHETKRAKDALTKDPYNLELIHSLGNEYMEEQKWTEAMNVLVRGWKRVGEFDNLDTRFEFLYQLLNASFSCLKFKQAHAVLMDMEAPEREEWKLDYYRMSCKVYSMHGDLQPTLKAFSQAVEVAENFDAATSVYFDTVRCLQRVGAKEAAKSTLEKLAKNDADRSKLKLVETMADMQATEEAETRRVDPMLYVKLALCSVVLCILCYMLYLFEKQSLRSLKLVKD